MNFTDVFHLRGIYEKDLKGKVSLTRAEIANFQVKMGDIFFTRTSETIDEIGFPSVMLDEPKDTVFSGFVLRGRALQDDPLTLQFKRYVFFTDAFRKEMVKKSSITTRALTSGTAIKNMEFVFPKNKKEQEFIGNFFRHLDRLITLHQCNCNMATRPCEWSSGLRAIAWEQRKFSDLVQIERGGSPRPIEKYITDEPNGLNWIKIGDAPLQGNYITKTDEKIKPSGLSKTRQVHPGDLILSNSMSFGRPYILAISGCIHDGWLLIRDVQNKFDLKFLCYLLGTDQMLDQYKALASGSTVNNLNKDLVGNTQITIPDITEQKVLGEYFDLLDRLITLHQRKHVLLT